MNVKKKKIIVAFAEPHHAQITFYAENKLKIKNKKEIKQFI